MTRRHVLVARLDNLGDVLLTGPAVRAVAGSGAEITFLTGPTGASAAELLPGVSRVIPWVAPWVPDPAPPVSGADVDELLATLRRLAIDEALVLTSFHQSPLPLALLLRLAGVGRIAATSVDYAGSLLDERVPYVADLHEVEQNLAVAAAAGHVLPPGDDGRLAVRAPTLRRPPHPGPYVVVHVGASVTARAVPLELASGTVTALGQAGWPVVLTGSRSDRAMAAAIAGGHRGVVNVAGTTDLPALASVLASAATVVVGNTGPAHLAAAVGTPVVSVFAPTVAPHRWIPWQVPHRVLGRFDLDCAGCRARTCPLPGQPCTAAVTPAQVVDAVRALVPDWSVTGHRPSAVAS
ncbi:MAG: glycosyl transferase, family 9 [Acidimicrobiales bacterium]|nr:glycosyl transferase, family 9 [Acidimicrobiales bacterium]